jgi:hypothetical protein
MSQEQLCLTRRCEHVSKPSVCECAWLPGMCECLVCFVLRGAGVCLPAHNGSALTPSWLWCSWLCWCAVRGTCGAETARRSRSDLCGVLPCKLCMPHSLHA